MLAKPNYNKKFLSMFHNKDEAFAHWKKFILSCMESKNLGIDDK